MEHVKYISISSGGVRATIYLGVLKALQKHYDFEKHLPNILGFSGTSAGAIIAMCLCIGYKIEELCQRFETMTFDTVAPEFDISLLLNEYGLNSGNKFKQLIGDLLQSKGLSSNITFRTLKQYFKSNLTIVTSAVGPDRTQHLYLNADTHPDLEIVDAIYMSACVPILFKPIQLNGIFYVDGAMTMHCPECFQPENTLVFDHTAKKTVQCSNLSNYITRLLSTSIDIQGKSYHEQCHLCIMVNIPDDVAEHGTLDRTHNESKNKRLFQIGFCSALACMNSKFTSTMDTILQMVLKNFVEFYQSNENDDVAY